MVAAKKVCAVARCDPTVTWRSNPNGALRSSRAKMRLPPTVHAIVGAYESGGSLGLQTPCEAFLGKPRSAVSSTVAKRLQSEAHRPNPG
jgi:hypothetical protein